MSDLVDPRSLLDIILEREAFGALALDQQLGNVEPPVLTSDV